MYCPRVMSTSTDLANWCASELRVNDMLRWVPSGVRYITRQEFPRWITAATATTVLQAETGNKAATPGVTQGGETCQQLTRGARRLRWRNALRHKRV